MPNPESPRAELQQLLRRQSVFFGDFVLSSGAKSKYYLDCRLTTLDSKGAWLVGQVVHSLIRQEAARTGIHIDAVGGLTLGADPIALATGMWSVQAGDVEPLRVFTVRKAPKAHGQTKLIEGNFRKGDRVVVLDDVVTSGESTIKAIHAVQQEGGTVLFAAVLVDRCEGGRQKIESLGLPVVSVFTRDEVLVNPQ